MTSTKTEYDNRIRANATPCRGCGYELTAKRVDKKGRCVGCGCPSHVAPTTTTRPAPWYMRPEFMGMLKPGAILAFSERDNHLADAMRYVMGPALVLDCKQYFTPEFK